MVSPQQSYPWCLGLLVGQKVANLGLSGDTTADGIRRLPAVLALKPRVVMVEFGINDFFLDIDLEMAASNLTFIIKSLLSVNSKVVLIGFSLPEGRTASWEEMYIRLGQDHGVPVMRNIYEGIQGRPELFLPDGIHPGPEGYKLIARNCYNFLVENSLLNEVGGLEKK